MFLPSCLLGVAVLLLGLSTNAGTVLSTIGSLEYNEHNGLNM